MDKKRQIITIIVNCIIAISVLVIATIGIALGAGDGQVGTYVIGWGYLKPYTMDSNIFTGIVAILVVVYSVKNINAVKKEIPKWLIRVYLMGTTCLVLTFMVAAFFLAPMESVEGGNYFTLFSQDMFFFHFLNPVLATVSFVLLFRDNHLRYSESFFGMIPTIIYSVAYFVMVVALKKWNDFYNFTFGGKYEFVPVVIAVIYGLALLISFVLIFVHERIAKREDI